MGICGWICTVIIFIALCVTAQSMFEDYLSYKSEKFLVYHIETAVWNQCFRNFDSFRCLVVFE